MVVDYLRKLQDSCRAEKTAIERRLNDYRLQIKENREFIRMLEGESDPSYESFTPREVHPKNREKILELQGKEEELQQAIERENRIYEECADKLEELDNVLREALQYEVEQAEREEREKLEEEEKREMVSSQMESVLHQIELCSEIAELDPRRCRIELLEILKRVRSEGNVSRETF